MACSVQFQNSDGNVYPHPYFPVGSIYLSMNNTNPSQWFGGTWEQIAQGRTLVGVDTSDNDFKTPQKIGGSKTHKLTINEMPSHNHTTDSQANRYASGTYWERITNSGSTGVEGVKTSYVGGNQPHNNLQPYITCYIWLRTA